MSENISPDKCDDSLPSEIRTNDKGEIRHGELRSRKTDTRRKLLLRLLPSSGSHHDRSNRLNLQLRKCSYINCRHSGPSVNKTLTGYWSGNKLPLRLENMSKSRVNGDFHRKKRTTESEPLWAGLPLLI